MPNGSSAFLIEAWMTICRVGLDNNHGTLPQLL
jgi:hypothetical protein